VSPLALALVLALTIPSGTVVHHHMHSPALDAKRSVHVYLPPSYSLADSATRRYPTVYLLHGWPGGEGNWPGHGHADRTADTLIATGRMPECILVFPNGRGRGLLGRSLYLDSVDGRSRVFTFVSDDLVRWVDSTFRTRPEPGERAVVGLSDGGSAALLLAFRRPDVFGACGGLSGRYRLQPEFGLGGVIGDEPERSRFLAANSPTVIAESNPSALAGLRIYFDCGLSDGPIEDNRELDRILTREGVPHEFHEFPGGHTWKYWRAHLDDALEYVTAGMRSVNVAEP
jgi:enterochelin esterase-like enzyme